MKGMRPGTHGEKNDDGKTDSGGRGWIRVGVMRQNAADIFANNPGDHGKTE